jgi:uncharacterized repeat protein (TIGR03803 family)
MTKLNAWKTASVVFVAYTAMAVAAAQTFNNLASFNGGNGSNPEYVSLVQGRDGNLFGTAAYGGPFYNGGTAFGMNPSGTLTPIYDFCLYDCEDGNTPTAGVIQSTGGLLFGTTESGGVYGYGTFFVITADFRLTTLHSFSPIGGDGSAPGGLVQGADGNFYGTTYGGYSDGAVDDGQVYRITPGGTLTTLHIFEGPDGAYPYDALVQGIDGNFYGTTYEGGANGYGTVFKITPGGRLTTLHSFDSTDGVGPISGLIQAADGNFYGTTEHGGIGGVNGYGTVFKVTPSGRLTTVHRFDLSDGAYPTGGLIQATDGNLYGTTSEAYAAHDGYGTVFIINPEGVLTTLHTFDLSDGAWPLGGLLQDTNGKLYGTTSGGGELTCDAPDGCGTIFSLDMGLGPFVAFVRAAGKVGQTGGILGQGFTGTTSVSLNGIPASFTVVSDTFLKATVPAGATTGYVTITTPTGTLTSNVPFHVIP